ncbi:PTS ascorbate transporter subunit IIC [Bacillus sp. B15-48]|uniref:PTS ascorbate transporter subunit IIC n=1 Tax=Bacillus sp. B15-48 TaxID=1548601 RepID=UPI00193F3DA6|nr:PTS ascorbate transporter subunit IIC [Bacillus sp. B15-48]MBM4761113.1 PTS ascorbate transporter subunit IIC [Bacillus sp. B15-48]
METFVDILINQILGQAPFLMGIIVFVGYILLGSGLSTAITGFIKASIGFMILQAGTGGLTSTFRPILDSFKEKYQMDGAIMDPYVALAAANEGLGDMVALVGYTLVIGFAWNTLLVAFSKYTKLRTLQVTGHVMFIHSTLLLFMAYTFLEAPDTLTVVLTGLLIGTYWAVFTNLTIDITNEVTDGGNFAIGHNQMLGLWLTSKIAPKVGNKEKSVDHLKFPKWLEMFNDNVVASTILMTIFFGTVMALIGSDYFETTLAFPLFIYMTTAKFAVFLTIILTGVQMFITELVNSFKGISSKILPNSASAVDIAAIYGFGHPNAILLGFTAGAVGQVVGVILLLVTNSPVFLILGFIPMFFDNAGIAVYANHFGGFRAAMLLPFASGFLQVSLGAFTYSISGIVGGVMATFDWVTVIPGFILVMDHFGVIGVVLTIILLLIIPQIQDRKRLAKVKLECGNKEKAL